MRWNEMKCSNEMFHEMPTEITTNEMFQEIVINKCFNEMSLK
jgi:hypothetical protein